MNGTRSWLSVEMRITPSSPTGCEAMKSAGRPSKPASPSAMRNSLPPVLMFRSNSWPIPTSSLFKSAIALRSAGSRSTPLLRKPRKLCSKSRLICSSATLVRSTAATRSYISRSSESSVKKPESSRSSASATSRIAGSGCTWLYKWILPET